MFNYQIQIRQKGWSIAVTILFCLFLFYLAFFSAPYSRVAKTIHVSNNDSLSTIANDLKTEKIIRNKLVFKLFFYLFGSDRNIQKGDFLFKKNTPVYIVALNLSYGKHNIEAIKITLREGFTNIEMADILSKKLANFNKELFLKDQRVKQGYMFPDTYLFYPLTSTEEVIESLNNNFKKRISSINLFIESSGKSLSDIIVMASIIEKEASGEKDASIISGILWKRIKLGMPLQVDVDLSTYKNKGLPNEPINNPGLISIKASVNPELSSYLYYLHDKNGVAHFAKNYEEHKLNINKYLK